MARSSKRRPTFAQAFSAIRRPNEDICLWVDALCIDQTNIKERNHQVKYMADIYQRAKDVLVWLGEDHEGDGGIAFDIARRVVSDADYASQIISEWRDHRRDISYLKLLACRRWFHRVWTMQEIGLANSATIICGDHYIDWDTLFNAYNHFHQGLTLGELGVLSFKPSSVTFLHKWVSSSANMSFMEVLEMARGAGATDKRDLVFALLSHPSAQRKTGERGLIVDADYGKSLRQIYIDTARGIIKDTGVLDVLSHIRRANEELIGDKLPSWVPAWHVEQQTYPFRRAERHSFGWCELFVYDESLQTVGVEAGTITWCSEMPLVAHLVFPHANSTMKSTWKVLRSRCAFRYGQSLHTVFGRTLTGGLLHPEYESKTAFASHQAEFEAYWQRIWNTNKKMATDTDHSGYHASRFVTGAQYAFKGGRLFCTSKGHVGLGPAGMKEGDRVFLLDYARTPFVLRKKQGEWAAWTLVGDCYIDDLMCRMINPGDHLMKVRIV